MNMCERDIIKQIQQHEKRKVYNFGDTRALMDIGNYRKCQEDSILITNHNEFQNIEMLLIADGIGGEKNGALASLLSAKQALYWFQQLERYDLKDSKMLKKRFDKFIYKLDSLIRRKCGEGGSTIVCAFLLNESILIANVGDSRAYVLDKDKLTQITTDHSVTQKLLENYIISDKENMRFHKENNLILSRVGGKKRLLELDFYEMEYSEVEKLFLFSDGVTDCISDNMLTQLVTTSIDETICDNIIEQVLNYDSYALGLDPNNYFDRIPAGKDNASMVYKKNRRIR